MSQIHNPSKNLLLFCYLFLSFPTSELIHSTQHNQNNAIMPLRTVHDALDIGSEGSRRIFPFSHIQNSFLLKFFTFDFIKQKSKRQLIEKAWTLSGQPDPACTYSN